MKKWNTPEFEALEIENTANGFFNTEVEFWFVTNDSKKAATPQDDEEPEKKTENGLS